MRTDRAARWVSLRAWGRPTCATLAVILALGLAATKAHAADEAPPAAVISRLEAGLAPPVIVTGEPVKSRSLSETMASLHVPGLSVAYIHEGRIAWTRAWGVAGPAGARVTPETRFEAGSVSKPVTAMAVLGLVAAGQLDLDADVNRYLRSWRVPDTAVTAQEKVTLRRLLTHTAGATVFGYDGYAAGEPVPSLVQILNGERPANSAPVQIVSAPGSVRRYSSGGYEIIQQLLIDVTGQSFPALMQKLVLAPAGMSHSTFEQPLPAALRGKAAIPFRGDGEPVPGGARAYPEMAAAGLWTTPSDIARLLIRLQNDLAGKPGGLLGSALAQEAMTPNAVGGWGLGFGLGGSESDRYFTHVGFDKGFVSTAIAFAHGDGVVVMTNGERGDDLMEAVVGTLAKAYDWPAFQPPVHTIAPVDDATLDAAVGRYRFTALDMDLTVARQGQSLSVRFGDDPPDTFFPEGKDRFFQKDANRQLTFHPGQDGKAAKITFRAVWNDLEGVRVSEQEKPIE